MENKMPISTTEPTVTSSRRSFLRKSMVAGVAGAGIAMLPASSHLFAQLQDEEDGSPLRPGDAALLRFAAAAEILEADFWIQYNELGGIQDKQVQGGSGNPEYTEQLEKLDEDFPQYIHDNTLDEITHAHFLNAYRNPRAQTQ
jgi:hypothetical protein